MYKFSKKSTTVLGTVDIKLQEVMREAIKTCNTDFSIIEGWRSAERQWELYKSKEKTGQWLTDKDGYVKKSKHQLRMAVDFCPYIDGKLDWNNVDAFWRVGRHIEATATKLGINIKWGGRWKVKDMPHVELI